MKRSMLISVLLSLSLVVLAGCTDASPDEDVDESQDEFGLNPEAKRLRGSYRASSPPPGGLAFLELAETGSPDGSYWAEIADESITCVQAPCTRVDFGIWNAWNVMTADGGLAMELGTQDYLKGPRVYYRVTLDDTGITLTRDGVTQVLRRVGPSGASACGGIAGLACGKGQECVDDPTDDCDPSKGGADCIGVCRAL